MPKEYEVLVGPKDSPILRFVNADMVGWNGEFAVDLMGDELSIDEIFITIYQERELAELYSPSDYDGVDSSDEFLFATNWVPEDVKIYDVPYGTAIRIYEDGNLFSKMYLESVERTGLETYRIHAISFIGLLEKKTHMGGVYNGMLFPTLLNDILNFTTEDVHYAVEDDVLTTAVFGWLPIASARDNLHQLLFSSGVSIKRGEDGDPVFCYIYDIEDAVIPQNRIFVEGTIKYPVPSTAVEVTEHTYLQLSTDEVVTLFDNTSTVEPLDHATITFDDAPVYDISVESSGFTIHTEHPNYAVISGIGTLRGKRYTHITQVIGRNNDDSDNTENIKRAEKCTLISVVNSENVADRMMNYYSVSKTVDADIVLEGERCGRKYGFTDHYGELDSAFLSKMSVNASAFIRAECEMLSGYVPVGQGNNYNHAVILTGSGAWQIPEEVFYEKDGSLKEHPRIRVVVIGGGDGGEAGDRGEDGVVEMDDGNVVWSAIDNDGWGGMPKNYPKIGEHAFSGSVWMPRTTPGRGGTGGQAGSGGKILSVTIDCTGYTQFHYMCGRGGIGGTVETVLVEENEFGNKRFTQTKTAPGQGTNTQFGEPWNVLADSDNGDVIPYGYLNVFDGIRYGAFGIDGVDGGNGGQYVENGENEQAGNVIFNGQTWNGGGFSNNGQPDGYDMRDCTATGSIETYYGGSGGGAAVGSDGESGGSYRQYKIHFIKKKTPTAEPYSESESTWRNVYGNGGNGGAASNGNNAANYGCGGCGGHGGGGGGVSGFGYASIYLEGEGYGYFAHTQDAYLVQTEIQYPHDLIWSDYVKDQTRCGYGGDGGNGGRGGNGCVIVFY